MCVVRLMFRVSFRRYRLVCHLSRFRNWLGSSVMHHCDDGCRRTRADRFHREVPAGRGGRELTVRRGSIRSRAGRCLSRIRESHPCLHWIPAKRLRPDTAVSGQQVRRMRGLPAGTSRSSLQCVAVFRSSRQFSQVRGFSRHRTVLREGIRPVAARG